MALLQRPRLILIDLDGTLVDSVPDLAYCVDETMRRLGRPAPGEQRVRDWVGNGVERLVRRALVGCLEGEPPEADFARAYPIFLDLYEANTARRSVLYPGIREGLDELQIQGYRLACVTNKAGRFAEPLLRELGIGAHFGLLVAGDSLPQKKPDPAPLLHAAAHFGVSPRAALMVGDSVSDVRAARAAGFAIVCMSYGYNHGQDIRAAHPDAVIDSLLELPGLLGPRQAIPSSPVDLQPSSL
jgi:phosphoglycolate phosphatase